MAATPTPPLRAASLFDIDAELAERLDARRRTEARSRAIVPVADLPAGPWSPEHLGDAAARPFALMVVDGLLVRELVCGGSTASELLGPFDIVSLGPPDDPLLPALAVWSVPQSAQVAVLDDRLLGILRTWPGVGRVLLDRAARREARLATHRAIAQLPRVDQRLLAFFAHLAERWGRVGPNGIVMPLHLTHETLGRLIGARRPTVSLALKDLAGDNLLERRGDGTWLLTYNAFERFGAEASIPAGWQPAETRPIAIAEGAGLPVAPPVKPGLTDEDIAALRARVDGLRTAHATSRLRSSETLERTRAARVARRGAPRISP
jgi:hypothetical protein